MFEYLKKVQSLPWGLTKFLRYYVYTILGSNIQIKFINLAGLNSPNCFLETSQYYISYDKSLKNRAEI